jgi:hypothetical protein
VIVIGPEPGTDGNRVEVDVDMHEKLPVYVPGLQSASYGMPASFDPRSKLALHPAIGQASAAQTSHRLIFGRSILIGLPARDPSRNPHAKSRRPRRDRAAYSYITYSGFGERARTSFGVIRRLPLRVSSSKKSLKPGWTLEAIDCVR